MTIKDTPAFPCSLGNPDDAVVWTPGITKREYFASQIIPAMIMNAERHLEQFIQLAADKEVSLETYIAIGTMSYVDALLIELENK